MNQQNQYTDPSTEEYSSNLHVIRRISPLIYSNPLKSISEPPSLLYVRGSDQLLNTDRLKICIIGSRRHSEYGTRVTRDIIRKLKPYNPVIVSGLATGIDTCALQSALDLGLQCIAVLGSGLSDDVIYPAQNTTLAHSIIDNGGLLISEYAAGVTAKRWSFPLRNRIMAGISESVVIIEGNTRSGTMITARLGLEYGRTIICVPGSIFSELSSGPLSLIEQGAIPLTSTDDILTIHGFEKSELTLQDQMQNSERYIRCTDEERHILDLINEPKNRDEILQLSGQSIDKLQIILVTLEIKGLIQEQLSKIYRI